MRDGGVIRIGRAATPRSTRGGSAGDVVGRRALGRWRRCGSAGLLIQAVPASRLRKPATVFSTTRSWPHCSIGCAIRSARRIGRCIISTVQATSDRTEPDHLEDGEQGSLPLRGRDVPGRRFAAASRSARVRPLEMCGRYGSGGATTPWSTAPGVTRESPANPKLLEPGPPQSELIELLEGVPEVLRRHREFVTVSVSDDRSPGLLLGRRYKGQAARSCRCRSCFCVRPGEGGSIVNTLRARPFTENVLVWVSSNRVPEWVDDFEVESGQDLSV